MPKYFMVTEGRELISPVVTRVWLHLTLFYLLIIVEWWVGTNVNIWWW